MKKYPKLNDSARIHMARTSGWNNDDEVQVNITSGDTHVRLGMSMLSFAELMTGSANVAAKVIRWETRKIPPFKTTRTVVTK